MFGGRETLGSECPNLDCLQIWVRLSDSVGVESYLYDLFTFQWLVQVHLYKQHRGMRLYRNRPQNI